MKRIDEKIDSYLTETSYPLKFMNMASDVGKFADKLTEYSDTIEDIIAYDLLNPLLSNQMKDSIDDIHMKLIFLKKNFSLAAEKARKIPKKNWLIDYMENK